MADRPITACLITNPRSGKGGIDLSAVLPILGSSGWAVTVRQKLHGGHATDLARQAAEEGYDVVVGAGGDGTLSEIVAGALGTTIAVGVLPGGTVNLWARELGISPRLSVAATQLMGAERRRVDVGRVTVNGRRRRHFVLMAGLGFDGAVMARVSKTLKNRVGRLAVGLAVLKAIPSFEPVPIRAELDGVHWEGRVSQIVVGNTRRYGGFTAITTDAYIDDGLLDVCLIEADGPFSAGGQLTSLLLRRRPSAATAQTHRVATLTIHAPVELPLQLDGGRVRLKEPVGEAGITYAFSVIAGGVTMLVPRGYSGELFSRLASPESLPGPVPPQRVPAGAAEEAGSHNDKSRKRLMTVMAVGVGDITAVRSHNGHVVRVLLSDQTAIEDEQGHTLQPREALATLAAGMPIWVKGKREHEESVIHARHVRILPQGAPLQH